MQGEAAADGRFPSILHKNKIEYTKVYSILMARWKGFEPPTFWFVVLQVTFYY